MDARCEIAWCIEQRRTILAREAHRLTDPEVKQGLYDLMAEEILIRLSADALDLNEQEVIVDDHETGIGTRSRHAGAARAAS
jgi:hypothetical protein